MSSRVTCARCRRPDDRCVCALASPVHNRTGVIVLQHAGERHHAFGTARLAFASLQRIELHVVWPDRDGRAIFRGGIPPGAALLYPRPDAPELGSLSPDAFPEHLVVLDGTWPQARVLYRDNPWLEALPHVQLAPAQPSRYRIRREPALHCLSTIESIGAALAVLEPETEGLQRLLDSFHAMVDTQADQDVVRVKRRKVRSRPSVIERLATGWDRVLLGYAESVPSSGGRRLSFWAAIRPASGELFEASADEPGWKERWAAFSGPDAQLACWSPLAPALLSGALGAPVDSLCLRSTYGNVRSGVQGYLDEIAAREGWVVTPLPLSGRASERLACAVALATFLRDRHR